MTPRHVRAVRGALTSGTCVDGRLIRAWQPPEDRLQGRIERPAGHAPGLTCPPVTFGHVGGANQGHDALGAGVSVAAMRGNLLLLDGKTVPAGLLPLLSEIHPSQVYLIGGPGLLSDAYVASVVADLGAPGP